MDTLELSQILMIGLDNSGKTTILYKLELQDIISATPTIGFNIETGEYNNNKFTCWDVGGEDQIRGLWRDFYKDATHIIFVIDSSDITRMTEAKDELYKFINIEELKVLPLLVFANKQDLPNALSIKEIEDKLELSQLNDKRSWYVQASCAISGEGLYEGLDWLATEIPNNHMRYKSVKSARK